jgi:hypothetical protein
MKLIAEVTQDIEILSETTKSGEKAMYITGPFMEYGIQNRNGRMYSEAVMTKAVDRYVTEKVNRNCAYGELNHPAGPQIDLERACILINSLEIKGNGKVIGKARITETPTGKIVKGLIESGANLGVSSRGLGSLKDNKGIMEVQDDFRLVTASDVVADPSAPNAFVKGIMEGVEWIYNEQTGEWAEDLKKRAEKTVTTRRELEEAKLYRFAEFISKL